MLKIVMSAALPDEYRPLKKAIGQWMSYSSKPFRSSIASFADAEIFLIETGMGGARALHALEWISGIKKPDLICSFGFAGGLSEEIQVGDVFLASTFRAKEASKSSQDQESLNFEPSPQLADFCNEKGIRRAGIVSVARAMPKPEINRLLNGSAALVDMESCFAAKFALREQIPFLCFRAISDALRDEIDFDPEAISGSDGRVRVLKVLAALARSPRLIGSFYRAWRRSEKASHNLCTVLASLLQLPPQSIKNMAEHSVLKSASSGSNFA